MKVYAFLAPAALAAVWPASSANAEQIVINFSGILTEATSFDFGEGFAKTDLQPGQAFTGHLGFNTESFVWMEGMPRSVNAFRFTVPEQNFGVNFQPVGGLAYRDLDGTYRFAAGRASFAANASIVLELPTATGQYPSAEALNGASGVFSFAVYGPGGGTGSGPVTLSSSVPESSTWAMMVVGIGAAGYRMRRRRRPTPIAT